MPSLWSGHQFSEDELEFWSQELASAAMDLPVDRRQAFLRLVSDGSALLQRRTDALLEHSFHGHAGTHAPGLCDIGDVVCDCIILGRIGAGGSAEVYKALQRPLRRLVAVKLLRHVSDQERDALAREAARVAQLHGEHIVSIFDADFTSERPAVVMEFVAGCTLRQWLDRRPPGPDGNHARVRQAAGIVRQICLALNQAHAQGIVHGDVKPENILVLETLGTIRVKLADFGLARPIASTESAVAGTPGYIAPEVLRGLQPDRRADIFAVGVVYYELLLGAHPFAGSTPAATLFNVLHVTPEIDGARVPGEPRTIVLKALQKEPHQRYPSVDELLHEVDAIGTPREYVGNPFLSEFPRGSREWLERHSSGAPVALASLVWGCVSAVLSIVVGAACVRVFWRNAEPFGTFVITYGYMTELNAGPWYMLGASFCALAGFGFLHAAHMGLARTSTLTYAGGKPGTALQAVAETNRRCFRILGPLIIAGAVSLVVLPEVIFRESNAFGWVQADLAAQYVGRYESDLRRERKMGPLLGAPGRCTDCDPQVSAVSNWFGTYSPPNPVMFAVFLTSALTHEIVLSAFLAYIAFKVLLFLVLLTTALLNNTGTGLRLVPDLRDSVDYRFGLGRIDNVYVATLLLVGIAALGRITQTAANLTKGTSFFSGNAAFPLIGQPLSISAVFLLLAILLVTPVIAFLLLAVRVVDQERARLAAVQKELQDRLSTETLRERQTRIQEDVDRLVQQRRTMDLQRLLPTARPVFWWLIAADITLLLLVPPLISTEFGLGFLRLLGDALCSACGNPPHAP